MTRIKLYSPRPGSALPQYVISGAIIASIVERAKGMAIKRSIAKAIAVAGVADPGPDEGISEADLQVAWNAEYLENEILPANDITEDWLKLIDYDPDSVVKISPVRMLDRARTKPTSGVI